MVKKTITMKIFMNMKNTTMFILGTVTFAVLMCYCFLDLFVNYLTNSEFNLFNLFILKSLTIKGKHNNKCYSTNKTESNFNKKNNIYC